MNAFSVLKPRLTAKMLGGMIDETFEMDELVHFVSIAPTEYAEMISSDGKLPTFDSAIFEEIVLNFDAIGMIELAVHAVKDGNHIAHFTWHGVVRDPFDKFTARCGRAFSAGAWPRTAKNGGTKKASLLIKWPRLNFGWEDWLFGFFQASAGYYSGPLTKADVRRGSLSRSSVPDDFASYVGQVLVNQSADEFIVAGGRGERIREYILKTYC